MSNSVLDFGIAWQYLFGNHLYHVPIMWLSFGRCLCCHRFLPLLLSLPLTVFIYAALLSIPFSFIPGIAMLLHFIAEKPHRLFYGYHGYCQKFHPQCFSLQYEFVKYPSFFLLLFWFYFFNISKTFIAYAMTTSFICCTVLYFVFFGNEIYLFTQSHVSYFNIQSNEALLITTRKETVLLWYFKRCIWSLPCRYSIMQKQTDIQILMHTC